MKNLTTEEFIKRSKNIHGDKYDYSLSDYKNTRTNIDIICDKHGLFNQNPKDHMNGIGCPKCGKTKKLTLEEFIEKSKEIHGDKYDYSLVYYINNSTKIKIICPIHGIFEQRPDAHIYQKQKCPKCSNNYNHTTNEFIEKLNIVHKNKYDYSLVKYINNRTKIKIICPFHGVFEQVSYTHLNGFGCPKCSNNYNYTTDEFINKSNNVHKNKYDYSLTNYKNSHTKIKIICPDHGEFEQMPYTHLYGVGCPICNESKGEKTIRNFLLINNINFIQQKKFDDCKHKQKLLFDFYLPDYNICIEYDGIQHFELLKYIGFDKFNIIQKRDIIKNNYCISNNIHLLRIKYNENILDILSKFFL